jgi:hypothetical protein
MNASLQAVVKTAGHSECAGQTPNNTVAGVAAQPLLLWPTCVCCCVTASSSVATLMRQDT